MKHIISKVFMAFICITCFIIPVTLTDAAGEYSGNGIRNNGVYQGITIDIYSNPYTSIVGGVGDPYGSGGCTWFVSGRVYELTGKKCAINGPYTWYGTQGPNNGFTSTQTLPQNHKSIICTEGQYVHVGIVEYVYSNGSVIISDGGCHLAPNNDYCNIGLYSSVSEYMSVMGLTKFIGYVDLGVPFTSDTTPPVISNVTVSNMSSAGYNVSCTVTDNIGVTRVAFPTWTENNWQDDIIWQDGTISNGVATFHVNISDHSNELGEYLTYIYAYDAAGNASEETEATHLRTYVDGTAPVISNIQIINLNKNGYTIKCSVSDDVGVTRVAFPTWTNVDWKDDIIWQDGTVSNGVATFHVNISDHGNQTGDYLTYIYAYDAAGNISEETATTRLRIHVDGVAPVINDIQITDLNKNGYTVRCNVSDDVGVTRVAFPTWTNSDWQDDIIWQNGSISDGIATFRVNISDHGYELGEYLTYIYAYDAAGNISEETNNTQLHVYLEDVAPVISNISVTDVTSDGYTVVCEVNDNIGVTRVAFPTWTLFDWQDDIIWQDGTLSDGIATFRVNISDHGNQVGRYYTYVYAYDAVGNVSEENDDTRIRVDVGIPDNPDLPNPDFILPTSLTSIDEEAFMGIDAEVVLIPEGCTYIGHRAFAECPNLRYVIVSDLSSISIEDDALEETDAVFVEQ